MIYYVGIDVSKGRMDSVILIGRGRDAIIIKRMKLDDTPRGWSRFLRELMEILEADRDARLEVGCEWTGGYEQRWLMLAYELSQCYGERVQVYGIHGQDVAQYGKLFRNRSKTDMVSAELIALYLMSGKKEGVTRFDPSRTTVRSLLSLIRYYTEEQQRKKNILHQLIHRFYPFILYDKATRGFPQYILELLIAYSRPELLARASVKELVRIPYLSESRARRLKEQAQTHIQFFQTTEAEGELIRTLARELLECKARLKRLEQQWESLHTSSKTLELLLTIPGIGKKTALVLMSYMGSIHRFPSRAKFVAFFGLAPNYEKSGDKTKRRKISKRGPSFARKCLYMAAMAAQRECPKFRKLYEHHLNKSGNHFYAMTCLMHHLLRIVYAVLSSEQPYDPNYKHKPRPSSSSSSSHHVSRSPLLPEVIVVNDGTHAPVSCIERSKRKNLNHHQSSRLAPVNPLKLNSNHRSLCPSPHPLPD